MIKKASILLIFLSFLLSGSVLALQDQGLSSVMDIIDRAIEEFNAKNSDTEASEEDKQKVIDTATNTVVNLSQTLGKLSYSRLQCGQAEVLAEFTQRVQKMPDSFRDPMRDAFQAGFDQGKKDTPLLSDDECKRLTESRLRAETPVDEAAGEEKNAEPEQQEKVAEPKPEEDPKLKHLRIAELSGQLAYKRKYCGDGKVVTRDFNEVIGNMPQEYQEEAKQAYWKGYKHGKRLNKGLTREGCL